jgi:hypothetical protein
LTQKRKEIAKAQKSQERMAALFLGIFAPLRLPCAFALISGSTTALVDSGEQIWNALLEFIIDIPTMKPIHCLGHELYP